MEGGELMEGAKEGRREGRLLDDACLSDGWEVDSPKTCWLNRREEESEGLNLRTSVEKEKAAAAGGVLRRLEACSVDAKSQDDAKHNVTIRCLSIGLKENLGQSG